MSYSVFPTWRSGNHDAVCLHVHRRSSENMYMSHVSWTQHEASFKKPIQSGVVSPLVQSDDDGDSAENRRKGYGGWKANRRYSRPDSQNQIKMSKESKWSGDTKIILKTGNWYYVFSLSCFVFCFVILTPICDRRQRPRFPLVSGCHSNSSR